jgi:hypothetical protein
MSGKYQTLSDFLESVIEPAIKAYAAEIERIADSLPPPVEIEIEDAEEVDFDEVLRK